jgi:hypothetical protein
MTILQRPFFSLPVIAILLSACATPIVPDLPTEAPPTPPANTPISVMSFETGDYRNLFQDYLGQSDTEVHAKLDAAWQQLFYGDDDLQHIYYPVGEDLAYIEDIGNGDVRTEGMSYGMMIAVQLAKSVF